MELCQAEQASTTVYHIPNIFIIIMRYYICFVFYITIHRVELFYSPLKEKHLCHVHLGPVQMCEGNTLRKRSYLILMAKYYFYE